MFGRRKMYKKGLADAMQAYEAFGRKQEAALEHMREEVRKGNQQLEAAISDLGEDLNGIYDHLTSKEKAALYHLSTPMDIKDLEDEEKRLLLAVLYQLSFDEGDDVTDAQRGYIRSVQKYLEITNPQTEAELSAVGDIDSLETQKAFLQVALEFLYLQDSDKLSDEQEDFLGYFSVNRKQAALIEERVSRLFNAVGSQGIAEKYGYVPEEEPEEIGKQKDAEINGGKSSEITVFEELADNVVEKSFRISPSCLETKNYIIVGSDSPLSFDPDFRIDKRTGEWIGIDCAGSQKNFPFFKSVLGDSIFANHRIFKYDLYGRSSVVIDDMIYYIDHRKDSLGIFAFDVDAWQKPTQVVSGYCDSISICGKKMAYVKGKYDKKVCAFDFDSGKQQLLADGIERVKALYAIPDGVFFSYSDPDIYEHFILSFYSYKGKSAKKLFRTNMAIQRILYVDDERIYLLCWDDEYNPTKCYAIPYKTLNDVDTIELSKFECATFLWSDSHFIKETIFTYSDMLLYVAKNGALKSLDYFTGETKEIVERVNSGEFIRIGKWIYYCGDEAYEFANKVSLDAPGEIEIIQLHPCFAYNEAEMIKKYGSLEACPEEYKNGIKIKYIQAATDTQVMKLRKAAKATRCVKVT